MREAIFNALHSAGAVDGARVLDLFAGSGALGIEALSRGAGEAVLVDHDTQAVATIRENVAATGVEGATVVRSDALAYLRSAPGHFDLALLDPPYAFDAWEAVLGALDATVVVVESDRELDLGERWEVHRVKRYGDTVVAHARRNDPERAT